MAPEPSAADSPFPGAQSQVPRMRDAAGAWSEPAVMPRSLPLESSAPTWERGWTVRLPVRAEHISVEKQVVAYERVVVRTREIDNLARLESSIRKEEVRVRVEGEPRLSPALQGVRQAE